MPRHRVRLQADGQLKPADPTDIATLFLQLCKGELVLQKLWNVNPDPSEEQIQAAIDQTVSVFLAAYGV